MRFNKGLKESMIEMGVVLVVVVLVGVVIVFFVKEII